MDDIKYDQLKKMLCKELEEYSIKTKMSAGDIDMIHKLTDTIKNIDKIGKLEDDEYSSRGSYRGGDWDAHGSYGDGYSRRYDNDGSEYSGARRGGRHYVRGHYSYDDGYSRGDAKTYMMDRLGEMMGQASSEKEREALERCMRTIKDA